MALGLALLASAVIAGTAAGSSGTSAAKTGGTMKINLSDSDFDYLDPALEFLDSAGMMTALCNYRLMTFADKAGAEGALPVPEAAAGPPVVTNGGKTYVFTIKKDVSSFNTGEKVTAQSFADAINRVLNPAMQSPGAPFVKDIVGAEDVLAGKAAKASGIKVAGNKLSITLTGPAPDFVARIAMQFFSAIPKNMPIDPQGVEEPAGAGPYYVKSWEKNRQAEFVRNPNYKGNRPRNIDRFVVTLNTDSAQSVLQVKSGQIDYDIGGPPPEAKASLAPLLNKQFFNNAQVTTSYLALNNQSPLFSNVNARKAVNYAVDRPALLRAFGFLGGKRDDQTLAPGLPGYRDVSIYPIKGANPTFAKKLWPNGGSASLYVRGRPYQLVQGQIVQYNLKQIGINVDLQQFATSVFYAKVGTKSEKFDMAMAAWGWDYPDPDDFIDILLKGSNIHETNNNNHAYFNNAAMDKKMEQANALTGDPRYKAYGNLDIEITKKFAPYANLYHATLPSFFSARMDPKCFVFQVILGRPALNAECIK